MTIKVSSAVALTKDQEKTLKAGLSKKYGADLDIIVSIQPELLGGLTLTIGSQHFDASVSGKLNQIRKSLQE